MFLQRALRARDTLEMGRQQKGFVTLAPIDSVVATVYRVPTDSPESDGTLSWSSTTMVVAEVEAAGERGTGWTYASSGAAAVIAEQLTPSLVGADAADIPRLWLEMSRSVRNIGRPGIGGCAIAAVDFALWDLKARLLGTSVVGLLGRNRDAVPAYGSGAFCSYTLRRLADQLRGWAESGFHMVKMKVGREPDADGRRVGAARNAIGPAIQLFVDANGAYSRKQALDFAQRFRDLDVTWFEEPVSSDDLAGLRLLRDQSPRGMDIAAGEYGWTLFDLRRLLRAEAVDVLQIDGTRCGGLTGFVRAAALCEAEPLPLSAHTSPTLHAHVCCCVPVARHVEYFHDHARIEHMLVDGALSPVDGMLRPDPGRPGFGVEIKHADAKEFVVWSSQ